jgi:replicative DNA helicase
VARDIRSTGQLFNDCENCIFVHRDEEEERNEYDEKTGRAVITDEGSVIVQKARNGSLGHVNVRLDGRTLTFVEA